MLYIFKSIHRKRTPPALNYTLGNTFLNVVNSHSYLGVTVSTPCLKKRPTLVCYNFDTHE